MAVPCLCYWSSLLEFMLFFSIEKQRELPKGATHSVRSALYKIIELFHLNYMTSSIFLSLSCYMNAASWDPKKESGSVPQLQGAKWFSFEDLKKCTDNFSESKCIGSGGYGKVSLLLFFEYFPFLV